MQETLAGELMAIMDKYEIDPKFINFEITETAMVTSKDVLLDNMLKLIEKSSNFYLDDYGIGYSNLNYIIGLPLHAIKLDKSIVWAAFNSEKGNITLEFVVRMIKHLNMQIVAEGIENQEQLEKMKELDVDFVQGYYFSRPVDSKNFIKFMFEYKER
jgi:EAL domain-containing protein (putative c-di-GMP-specific phosphodiesterase class I)